MKDLLGDIVVKMSNNLVEKSPTESIASQEIRSANESNVTY